MHIMRAIAKLILRVYFFPAIHYAIVHGVVRTVF